MGTAFVCGGTGFIGRGVVRELVSAGHRVRVPARRESSAVRARAAGAEPVEGDMLVAGAWQDAARDADWVVHLAQPRTFGGRVTAARARRYRDERIAMDRLLLDSLRPGRTRRVVYVAGTSYYGDLGTEPRDERATPNPRGWGPYVAPAVEALGRDLARGLPIVTAFPGYVYGDGSWFREYVLTPLRRGERIHTVAGRSHLASPVHVDDCARALVHLLSHGEVGARYFVVDDRPVPWSVFYETAARAVGREMRVRKVPVPLFRLFAGSVVADTLLGDAALSNARLRATGFDLRFPTIDEGLPDVARRARP